MWNLRFTLPPRLSATSGMNAIAHAVEGLYAEDRNPIVTLMALEAIRAMAEGLPAILDRPRDPAARAKALYGAWLCGTVLARSAWLCITNFATSLVVRLICPTRKRTRSCCLTW